MLFQVVASFILSGFIATLSLPVAPVALAPYVADERVYAPVKTDIKSLGVAISAPYAVVIDEASGAILYEKNKDLQSPIASITKLMTALVFLRSDVAWDTEVTMTAQDFKPGNVTYLSVGDRVTVKDLFYLALIASANEAAMALARSTGLTPEEFVRAMNKQAQAMGLRLTSFIDPTGLETANISTAYEAALLARAAFRREEIRAAVILPAYTVKPLNRARGVTAYSTDKLLDSFVNDAELEYQIIGAKTGYLKESRYCLTAKVAKNKQNILITTLGSETDAQRWAEAKGLIDWTYTHFRWP